MQLIDTHTHIYANEFDHDRDEMIARAIRNGVEALFLPAIDSEHHDRMLQVVARHPGYCFPMMGLHPTSVKAGYAHELSMVQAFLESGLHRFYAIGEVGIDLYWDKTFAEEQKAALEFQFDLAIRYDLPLVIHTRNSMDIVLEMLDKRNDARLRGIFHCFGGNLRQAEHAISHGFLLGIGGVITYKNSGLQQVVEAVSADHLVVETDAPWLPPVPHRGQRNEPAYLTLIAGKIAEIKGMHVEEAARITSENAQRVFRTERGARIS